MAKCHVDDVQLVRLLDGDLSEFECSQLVAHARECPDCADRIRAEQALAQLLRAARPLYRAPKALEIRIASLVGKASTGGLRTRLRVSRLFLFSGLPFRFSTLGLLLVVACAAVTVFAFKRVQAARYVDAALAAHALYVGGTQMPQIQATSAQIVENWFAPRLPFALRLPHSPSVSPSQYRLVGAGLSQFGGYPAAYILYERDLKPADRVSLLIAPGNVAAVLGGIQVQAGGIAFHVRDRAPYRVITWKTHGLSYALVSSASRRPRESCMVCHENTSKLTKF